MAKTVLIDQFHLSVRVPADLPAREADEVTRVLDSPAFLARLRRAVKAAFRAFPELAHARPRLAR